MQCNCYILRSLYGKPGMLSIKAVTFTYAFIYKGSDYICIVTYLYRIIVGRIDTNVTFYI